MNKYHTPSIPSGDILETIRLNYRYRDGKLWDIWYAQRKGYIRKDDYREIHIRGKHMLEHYVIWYLCKGEWPKSELHHKNEDKSDNTIGNLELSNRVDQITKTTASKKRKHFYLPRGVTQRSYKGHTTYRAQIRIDRKTRNLGHYDNPQHAWIAYCAAYDRHYGCLPPVKDYLPIKYFGE